MQVEVKKTEMERKQEMMETAMTQLFNMKVDADESQVIMEKN